MQFHYGQRMGTGRGGGGGGVKGDVLTTDERLPLKNKNRRRSERRKTDRRRVLKNLSDWDLDFPHPGTAILRMSPPGGPFFSPKACTIQSLSVFQDAFPKQMRFPALAVGSHNTATGKQAHLFLVSKPERNWQINAFLEYWNEAAHCRRSCVQGNSGSPVENGEKEKTSS